MSQFKPWTYGTYCGPCEELQGSRFLIIKVLAVSLLVAFDEEPDVNLYAAGLDRHSKDKFFLKKEYAQC